MSNTFKSLLLTLSLPALFLTYRFSETVQARDSAHALAGSPINTDGRLRPESAEKDKKKKKKDHKIQGDTDDSSSSVVLWRDPIDIEKRDLFYGIGGKEGAPSPTAKYTFIKESSGGTQQKIVVKDDRGREWTVKFGLEAKPETAASRIVWAAGYHTDQDYFVEHAVIEGTESYDARDVRFERRNDGYKEIGPWSWKENPMEGTRELNGLKVLMGLVNNWDLKTDNNRISREGKNGPSVYYVSDLGASFGRTGSWLNKICFFSDLPADKWNAAASKGDPKAYTHEPFIEKVRDGMVVINHERLRGRKILEDIPAAHALWIGNLLGRLSDKQLGDAFRGSGFDPQETAIYVRALRERINELRALPDPNRFAARSAAKTN